jgi:hypothetical protein
MGQFYPDRIFVLAGFLLFIPLYYNAKPQYLFATLIFTALINERAGLIAGMIICAHSCMFFQQTNMRRSITGIAIGALGIAYFYLQKNYLLENAYYNKFMPHSFSEILVRLQLPNFTENILINLNNNSPLLFLSLFAPRYLLISLAIMLPNIIGKVGGGEKIGWLTHYHSYYFPVLAFSATVGFIKLYQYGQQAYSKRGEKVWLASILCILAFTYTLQSAYKINKFDLTPTTGLREHVISFKNYASDQPTGLDFVGTIRASFNEKDIVATTELGMALLHNKTKIHVFPIGLASATKVFIPCPLLKKQVREENIERQLNLLGFIRSADSNTPAFSAISYCLLERQERLGIKITEENQ